MTFRISAHSAFMALQERWECDEDAARRILDIARTVGPDAVPVTDGYITVRYHGTSPDTGRVLYSIEPPLSHQKTEKGVAAPSDREYTQGSTERPIRKTGTPVQAKGTTMPARGRKPAPAPEPEVTENGDEDYTRYLEKDLTPTMVDYADWFEDNVAKLDTLEADRILALGTTLYPKFQKSDFNIERREARRAERETAAPEPEPAPAPARGRGRSKPATATAAPAAAAPARTRGRGRTAAASGAAPY